LNNSCFTGRKVKEAVTVAEGLSRSDRDRVMMIEGRVLKPEDRIHDLDEVVEALQGAPGEGHREGKSGPERIFDLLDVVEKKPKMAFIDTGLHDDIMKRAAEITEKVAREVIPDLAERIIRDEIEKLKKGI
jgi:hypothetical protein